MVYRNWLTHNLAQRSIDPLCDFQATINPYSFVSKSFQEECDITAKKIATEYPKIFIGLSGGYDSEFVCRVFIRNSIPFKPIIVSFMDNNDERKYAEDFIETTLLDPIRIQLSKADVAKILYHHIIMRYNGVGIYSIGQVTGQLYAENNGGVFVSANHLIGDDELIDGFQCYIPEWDFYMDSLNFFLHRIETSYAMLQSIKSKHENISLYKSQEFGVNYRKKNRPKFSSDIYEMIAKVRKIKPPPKVCSHLLGTIPQTLSLLNTKNV